MSEVNLGSTLVAGDVPGVTAYVPSASCCAWGTSALPFSAWCMWGESVYSLANFKLDQLMSSRGLRSGL